MHSKETLLLCLISVEVLFYHNSEFDDFIQ